MLLAKGFDLEKGLDEAAQEELLQLYAELRKFLTIWLCLFVYVLYVYVEVRIEGELLQCVCVCVRARAKGYDFKKGLDEAAQEELLQLYAELRKFFNHLSVLLCMYVVFICKCI